MISPGKCSALVLAAGKGTRMKSATPKVMQPLLEEPMLYYVLQAVRAAGVEDTAVVVGHGGEQVEKWLAQNAPGVEIVWQREQLGTGHAVMSAADWLKKRERVLIVNGDMPMITPKEIGSFLERAGSAETAFMTCDLNDPASYGRVVRSENGVGVVEAKDASPEQLAISEINVGVYLFDVPLLLEGLSGLTQSNSQKEYYIVDLIAWACRRGANVAPVKLGADNLAGVNSPLELAELSLKMRDRLLADWMLKGVKCVDPATVWISPRVVFHGEAFLSPNVQIWGRSEVGDGCRLGSGTVIRDCVLKNGVQCLGYVVAQDIVAEENVKMGPFCFLRDGTHLLKDSFVGKFVEIKNSEIGEGTKVPHLSYMGDAVIGPQTNIGAASVTCNYDGISKNKTRIGARCFIGSDTMLVAPVTVADGATIGAGSVITKDVPEGALAVARARQVVLADWAKRKKTEREKNMGA